MGRQNEQWKKEAENLRGVLDDGAVTAPTLQITSQNGIFTSAAHLDILQNYGTSL